MMRSTVWMVSAAFTMTAAVAQADDIVPLQLIKWLPVEGPENLQPSGLTIRNDSLFTVSDKHDGAIFEIKIGEQAAVLKPAVVFPDAPALSEGKLDLEGITCDEEGNFYLASEKQFRILRVDPAGKDVAWVTPSLRSYGEAVGLFRTRGAYLEGITHLEANRFVLCAEREPRGLIEVTLDGEHVAVEAYARDESRFHFPKGRPPDFTGLFRDGHGLYALERNAYLICQLIPGEQGYEEGPAWSYEHIATSAELRYVTMTFGRGEGLCMDADRIYVILDNNGQARESQPDDHRPLILIMARPKPLQSTHIEPDPLPAATSEATR